jgi:hypothetical protein
MRILDRIHEYLTDGKRMMAETDEYIPRTEVIVNEIAWGPRKLRDLPRDLVMLDRRSAAPDFVPLFIEGSDLDFGTISLLVSEDRRKARLLSLESL